MRRLLLALLLLAAPAAHAELHPYLAKPYVSFRPLAPAVDIHPLNPHVHYVGGYELEGHLTYLLTGLSDIQVFPDGNALHVEAVSDYGAMARFDMVADGKGGYRDSPLEIGPLRDASGKPFYDKALGDSEDIAYNPANGDRYVSFEGAQRILKYRDWNGPGELVATPGLPVFPNNEGMEGLTYIHEKGGDSLLIGVEIGGFWRCSLVTPGCQQVTGPKVPGFWYMMTSLAVLDYKTHDHDILALYRYYDPITGPRNILRLLRLEGDRLTVVEDLAKIAPPLPYNNYEGVSAIPIPGGYRLFLISDALHDGENPRLLIFDWKP